MMTVHSLQAKQAERDELDEAMREYAARGGLIERVPPARTGAPGGIPFSVQQRIMIEKPPYAANVNAYKTKQEQAK